MGLGEGHGVSREGGRELFWIREGGWWGTDYVHEGSLATGG